MTTRIMTPSLRSTALVFTLGATLAACGGDGGSSSRPATHIDEGNAAQVIQAVLMTEQLLPGMAMVAPSLFGGMAEEGCLNDGTFSITGDISSPPSPGAPISITANDCQLGFIPEMNFTVNGGVAISAIENAPTPASLLFDYDAFNLHAAQSDETASMDMEITLDGNLRVSMDDQSVRQASIRLSMAMEATGEEVNMSDELDIQTSNYDVIVSNEMGLGTLRTFSGGLRVRAPLDINLTVSTHEGIDIHDCTMGDLSIETASSSVNVSFDDGSVLVTLNGVQDTFESCAAFYEWLEETPLFTSLPF